MHRNDAEDVSHLTHALDKEHGKESCAMAAAAAAEAQQSPAVAGSVGDCCMWTHCQDTQAANGYRVAMSRETYREMHCDSDNDATLAVMPATHHDCHPLACLLRLLYS